MHHCEIKMNKTYGGVFVDYVRHRDKICCRLYVFVTPSPFEMLRSMRMITKPRKITDISFVWWKCEECLTMWICLCLFDICIFVDAKMSACMQQYFVRFVMTKVIPISHNNLKSFNNRIYLEYFVHRTRIEFQFAWNWDIHQFILFANIFNQMVQTFEIGSFQWNWIE